MKQAFKGFIKAFVIVSVLFSILYFVSYRRWLNRDIKSSDIKYNYIEEGSSIKNVDLKKENKSDFSYLYNKVSYEFLENNFGEDFFDYYYGNKLLSDEYYIFVGIINLIHNELVFNCKYDKVISTSLIDESIKSIFGDVKYNNTSFVTSNKHLSVEYDDESLSYHIKTDKCSGFDYSNGGIKSEIYEVYSFNNNLYIDEKVMYLDYSLDSFGNIIFNYHSGISKNDKIISNKYEEINKNDLPVYRYSFIEKNGKYFLKSIKKIK